MAPATEEEHEALLQFLYLAPIGLVQMDRDGEIGIANPRCVQLLLPLTADGQMTNLFTVLEDAAPDLRQRMQAFAKPYGSICDAVQLSVQVPDPRGPREQVLSLSLLKLDEERLMAVVGDITQAVQRERELRQSRAWLDSIAAGIADYALVRLDGHGRVRDWNPSIGQLTGFGADTVTGRCHAVFYPPGAASSAAVPGRLHEADRTGWSSDEGWFVRADGSGYWGRCLISPLHAPGEARIEERAYSLVIRSFAGREPVAGPASADLARDLLTGLPNRGALIEQSASEFERWRRLPQPLTLAVILLDRADAVVERYGPAAADALLRQLAQVLQATFRGLDFVARTGRHEFVVLMPATPIEGGLTVSTRVCHGWSAQPVEAGGVAIASTISVGIAGMQAGVDGVNGLLHRARMAAQAAEHQGGDRAETWSPPFQSAPAAADDPVTKRVALPVP